MKLLNTPDVKIGLVGVSRDCFPLELTQKRLDLLFKESQKNVASLYKCPIVIENEVQSMEVVADLEKQGCNALVIYLGNFGPENPIAILAEKFNGPVMLCSAAEETKASVGTDRGDALCGLMNASMACDIRGVNVHIPQNPCALPAALSGNIADFENIARVLIGVKNVKIFGFGPRPQDFLACNAPIKGLFDLGVEIMENSELDLFQAYEDAAAFSDEIQAVVDDMKNELGDRVTYPDLLPKMAQLEVALLHFMEENKGMSDYVVFADKCWPAFERQFGFVPCYVNSRLTGRGIPVACEVDLYGALSEYMVQLATMEPATLLDINNSVPEEMNGKYNGKDLHMGFHCGNTCSDCMADCKINYQVIMNRLMEDGGTPDITRGTLEGMIKPGETTLFRLQASGDSSLKSYIAEGEFTEINPETFGSTGVVAIKGFNRFYRHVLVGKHFPHHGAYGRAKAGKILFEAVKYLGIKDIYTPLPSGVLYEGENPFDCE